MIKEVLVKKYCTICRGNGCYDCGEVGFYKEWITFEIFMKEVEEYQNYESKENHNDCSRYKSLEEIMERR